jgi:hypothetical protein
MNFRLSNQILPAANQIFQGAKQILQAANRILIPGQNTVKTW